MVANTGLPSPQSRVTLTMCLTSEVDTWKLIIPVTNCSSVGDTIARAGRWLSTIKLMATSAAYPAASSALAFRLCTPSDRPEVFQS